MEESVHIEHVENIKERKNTILIYAIKKMSSIEVGVFEMKIEIDKGVFEMKIEIDKEWVSITCDNCGETYTFSHEYIRKDRAKMCANCSTPYKKIGKKVLEKRS